MKNWDIPKIFTLGIESTMGNDHNCTDHYCHQTDPAQYPCPGEPPEHSNVPNKPHVFSGNECPIHTVGGESACCCYVPTVS